MSRYTFANVGEFVAYLRANQTDNLEKAKGYNIRTHAYTEHQTRGMVYKQIADMVENSNLAAAKPDENGIW